MIEISLSQVALALGYYGWVILLSLLLISVPHWMMEAFRGRIEEFEGCIFAYGVILALLWVATIIVFPNAINFLEASVILTAISSFVVGFDDWIADPHGDYGIYAMVEGITVFVLLVLFKSFIIIRW